jgi:uncharacterized phiE125 gp8 family phage protein
MSLALITPPAAVPVSMAEVKAQCRIDSSDEDALLAGYVRSAVDMVENMSGLRLISQVWDWSVDTFPGHCGWLRLPLAPLMSIPQVVYMNEAGAVLTLASSVYLVRGIGAVQPGRLILAPDQEWPVTWRGVGAVTVHMMVGFGSDHNAVPHDLRQAASMLVAYWFSQREAASIGPDSGPVSDVPFSVKQILAPYRVWAV